MSQRDPPAGLDAAWLRDHALPPVNATGDKESRGHVLVVGGSDDTPGAALLSAMAALGAGAGKLTILTTTQVAVAVGVAMPEAKVIGARSGDAAAFEKALERLCQGLSCPSVVLIGPGMSEDDGGATATRFLQRFPELPLVLDAAAMRAAIDGVGRGGGRPAPVLLTPHAGELAGLCDCSKEEVTADPCAAAMQLARMTRGAVLLKGSRTVLASPEAVLWEHRESLPGLATSGSGDVLSGVIAGLLAQGTELSTAAGWGVSVHARCGAMLAAEFADVGYLARDMARVVPRALRQLGRDSAAPTPR
ncbi:MAG: NAD(P)H-hydrate dehydratase [Pseudomonadota bacterium]|nr:NAD(P)H-hydrate dehydratase [Pseudomonadota bacterium]